MSDLAKNVNVYDEKANYYPNNCLGIVPTSLYSHNLPLVLICNNDNQVNAKRKFESGCFLNMLLKSRLQTTSCGATCRQCVTSNIDNCIFNLSPDRLALSV